MSPASYVTSEMKTNIAQRKKKRPPSSFSFSRTGTLDASGSLFLPTQALDLCVLDQPHQTRTPDLYRPDPTPACSALANFFSGMLRGPGENRDADQDPVDREGQKAPAADPGHQGGDAPIGDREGNDQADRQHHPPMK